MNWPFNSHSSSRQRRPSSKVSLGAVLRHVLFFTPEVRFNLLICFDHLRLSQKPVDPGASAGVRDARSHNSGGDILPHSLQQLHGRALPRSRHKRTKTQTSQHLRAIFDCASADYCAHILRQRTLGRGSEEEKVNTKQILCSIKFRIILRV